MENLRFTKNQLLKSVKQLFQVTERLIKDQTEIGGLTTIDYEQPTWRSTTPPCDRAIEITNAKNLLLSDSVLCLGSIRSISDQPIEAWKNQKLNSIWKLAFSKIWIESMESRWSSSGKSFQGSLHWVFSRRFNNWLNCRVNLSSSKVGSSSCQCTTTLYGENEETQKNAVWILLQLRMVLADSCWDVGHFWGRGSEKKWYGTHSDKPDGSWDRMAEEMMLNFAESGHPIFRATGAKEKWRIKKQRQGKEVSFHYNGSEETIELILRIDSPHVYFL